MIDIRLNRDEKSTWPEGIIFENVTSGCRLTYLVKSGSWLQLFVQDHGRGLDKKERKLVFDRFYRVQPPGDNVRGTGLGLYIVESVIKGYGGTVGVTSDGPGKGCTFTVKFPAL